MQVLLTPQQVGSPLVRPHKNLGGTAIPRIFLLPDGSSQPSACSDDAGRDPVIPVGDASALAAAMERLLTDKGLAAKLGLAGLEQVQRRFQQEHIWESLHAEYLSVLQTKEDRELLSPYSEKNRRLLARSNR